MKKKDASQDKGPVIPRHVAVIMDGNGRWARHQGLPRRSGHREGAESVRVVVEECARHGVEQLTLYVFSTENWSRPKSEVNYLMGLMKKFLVAERPRLMENQIRLKAIGRLEKFPADARRELEKTIEMSRNNTGMILRMALNYGGRQEIVDVTRRLVREAVDAGLVPETITQDTVSRFCYDAEMTDPDLLIRTGGEKRLSNFLLWQSSYTELYFTRTCWPDFRARQLQKAFEAYARRERRFGGLPHKRKQRRKRG